MTWILISQVNSLIAWQDTQLLAYFSTCSFNESVCARVPRGRYAVCISIFSVYFVVSLKNKSADRKRESSSQRSRMESSRFFILLERDSQFVTFFIVVVIIVLLLGNEGKKEKGDTMHNARRCTGNWEFNELVIWLYENRLNFYLPLFGSASIHILLTVLCICWLANEEEKLPSFRWQLLGNHCHRFTTLSLWNCDNEFVQYCVSLFLLFSLQLLPGTLDTHRDFLGVWKMPHVVARRFFFQLFLFTFT